MRKQDFALEVQELLKLYAAHPQVTALDTLLKNDTSRNIFLKGLNGSGPAMTIASLFTKGRGSYVCVLNDQEEAGYFYHDLMQLTASNEVYFFPSAYRRAIKYGHVDPANEILRTEVLSRLQDPDASFVIVTYPDALAERVVAREVLKENTLKISVGEKLDNMFVSDVLDEYGFEQVDYVYEPGQYALRGSILDVFSFSNEFPYRIDFFGDEIDRICEINALTGQVKNTVSHVAIYPASHYVVAPEKLERAIDEILKEMEERVEEFTKQGKLLEAQRIKQRTEYDMEMLKETGFCKGIENYSRIMSGRAPGSAPFTLLDYFPKDFVLFVDESHVTLPQVRAMYGGDRSRKDALIDFGFRLPSAYDNRPLTFDEFYSRVGQKIFVSATPGDFEREKSSQIVEQVIRPTGLLDPEIIVKPTDGQIEDLISEINIRIERKERVLVTTLTKKMAESLTEFLDTHGIKVRYMHYDVDTIERMEIIRDLRLGEFDVLVGINLLREGLDIPEVSLVAILDADKEGFLRSTRSLIQIAGRAARNSEGTVIMYADSVTPSMEKAISETYRRREIQTAYNKEHHITPKTIKKDVRDIIEISTHADDKPKKRLSAREREALIVKLTAEMKAAAKILEFEHAAMLRDKIQKLREGK